MPSTSAAVGHDRLDAGHRPGVAVAVGRTDVGPPPAAVWATDRVRGRAGEGLEHRALEIDLLHVDGERWWRDDVADPRPSSASGSPDGEVGAERPGDLLGEELLERPPDHAADDLADQVALVQGVVARRGARLPTTGAWRGQHLRGFVVGRESSTVPVEPTPTRPTCATSEWRTSMPPCRWRRTRANRRDRLGRVESAPLEAAPTRARPSWSWWSTTRW